MLDWHVLIHGPGQQPTRPTTHESAQDAIEAANAILQRSGSGEVTVYHRLYSNQACLTFDAPIPGEEIHLKASHLEHQVQAAARSG